MSIVRRIYNKRYKGITISILLAATSSIILTACSNEHTIKDVDRDLQGTWIYEEPEDDDGYSLREKLTFENGVLSYISYVNEINKNDKYIMGTYEVLEDCIVTELNDFKCYFPYEYEKGKLTFSIIMDSGADAGVKRIYRKL